MNVQNSNLQLREQELQVRYYTQLQAFANTSSRLIAAQAQLDHLTADLDRLKGLQLLQHNDLVTTEQALNELKKEQSLQEIKKEPKKAT